MKIEGIYSDGVNLAGDAREISEQLYGYNPGINKEDIASAPQIAHSIAVLMQRYAKLRVDLLEVIK